MNTNRWLMVVAIVLALQVLTILRLVMVMTELTAKLGKVMRHLDKNRSQGLLSKAVAIIMVAMELFTTAATLMPTAAMAATSGADLALAFRPDRTTN